MVAIFKTGSSLKTILNYNENKVQKGVAACIHSENYPMEHEALQFHHKLNRLLNQAALNKNVSANGVHISLNFDPSEKLADDTLRDIANSYMEQIGFGEQPYLVYRHEDAGHPHIHIVSVKVDATGKRIDTQNIGKNQSEKARKQIEKTFGLVRAEDSKNNIKYELEPVSAQRVQYGKSGTKRAISNVLAYVLPQYKFSSLHELNAVLKVYNVIADRGSETSLMYKSGGLMFQALDDNGKKIGAPIKASQFYMKPTLQKLEAMFAEKEPQKQLLRERVRGTINKALLFQKELTLPAIVSLLQQQGIRCILRQNDKGQLYGITYVDVKNKAVFNGSDLGKSYSAKGMLERCQPDPKILQPETFKTDVKQKDLQDQAQTEKEQSQMDMSTDKENLIDILTKADDIYQPVPFPLKKTVRKRKGKRL